MNKPIAFTLGDPLGIGPETIARLYASGGPELEGCFVCGDVAVMRRAASFLGSQVALPVAQIASMSELSLVPPRCIPVWQAQGLPPDLADLPMGVVDARAGRAAVACIEQAVALALRGEVAAVVTAPIHKEALAAAGSPYPGHTEMLQALSAQGGSPPPVRMMLANDELRVVLVTIHMSLRKAIDAITFDAVLQTLRITHDSAAAWGQLKPRIAVAGLNPHAGEGGLFGDEEQRIIAPAIQAARDLGMDAHGPFAPDTIFMRARRRKDHPAEFDAVLAMTHDHGLIPVKYLGVEHGVNVTLGLPFVRTSPDHGTAFDIAGRGQADASSLLAALRMARQLGLTNSQKPEDSVFGQQGFGG
jgi:4-hydroxythreonine-4-phosphate dehydrogenase